MKKAIIIAVTAGLAITSAVAFAQMQHGGGGDTSKSSGMQGGMHGGMMHGGMMHGEMMQGKHGGMSGAQDMQAKGDNGPSSLAFHGINMKMHSAMNITYTGNADVDFVKGMIPHHAGAVDMAKVVLAFGKDPELKKLAESIIAAQESEIALMQNWLQKNSQ